MIYSPIEINVKFDETKKVRKIRGVLLEKAEIAKVVKLIDKSNSDGLKGNDAILLMRLKDAAADLAKK
jgi:hypothetical protein